MDAEDLPLFAEILRKNAGKDYAEIPGTDRQKLMQLSFSYIEEKNRLGLLNQELKAKIVTARKALHDELVPLNHQTNLVL